MSEDTHDDTTGPTDAAPATEDTTPADIERVVYPAVGVPAVLAAICEAMQTIGAVGKGKTSDHGNFKFRGVDDAMNALAPVMRAHCLFVTPRLVSIERTRLETKNGGGLMNTLVEVEFDFISGADGSKHTVGPIPGEGMDTGDKSTAKAMSVAMRTMLWQVFMIPTEDRDPDHDVYEVANGPTPEPAPRPASRNAPARKAQSGDYDPWADDDPTAVTYYTEAINACGNNGSLRLVWDEVKDKCVRGEITENDGKHLSNLVTRRINHLATAPKPPTAADGQPEFHAA